VKGKFTCKDSFDGFPSASGGGSFSLKNGKLKFVDEYARAAIGANTTILAFNGEYDFAFDGKKLSLSKDAELFHFKYDLDEGVIAIEKKMVTTTKYSLYETGLWWKDIPFDKVTIINNEEELRSHLAGEGIYPAIDFSKHSLLLAKGGTTFGVQDVDVKLFEYKTDIFSLDVTLFLTLAALPQGWQSATLAPKIPNDAIITMNVKQTHDFNIL